MHRLSSLSQVNAGSADHQYHQQRRRAAAAAPHSQCDGAHANGLKQLQAAAAHQWRSLRALGVPGRPYTAAGRQGRRRPPSERARPLGVHAQHHEWRTVKKKEVSTI